MSWKQILATDDPACTKHRESPAAGPSPDTVTLCPSALSKYEPDWLYVEITASVKAPERRHRSEQEPRMTTR